MKKVLTSLLAVIALLPSTLFVGQNASAHLSVNKKYSSATKQAKASVDALLTTTEIPGLSVAVAINGEIVWSEGFGYANLEQRVPVTSATRFRVGSVSKILTIAAIAKLYEQGRVDIDAPIQKYVPSFPQKEYPITTRQIAGHLAGIRHYTDKDSDLDFRHFDNVLSSLSVFRDDPLLFPPGTKYSYSSFGYNLLGAVVEGASGKDFLTFMNDEVFQPLGLKSTTADQRSSLIPNRTNFYERGKDTKIINAPYVDPSYKWPSGGFLTTAEDLVRFGSAHLRTDFFAPPTLKLLFTSQKTSDGKETGVGLGWRVGKDWRGRRILHHAGNIAGARAILMLYPDDGLSIALLSNLSSEPGYAELTAQMIAEPFLRAVNSNPVKQSVSLAGIYQFTGDYKGQQFTGKLQLIRTGERYEGWLTGLAPLTELCKRYGLPTPERLRIPNVLSNQDAPVLVLATPLGLFNVPAKFDGAQFSSELTMGPLTIAIRGTRVSWR